MATNPFDQFDTAAPTGPVFGPPPVPKQPAIPSGYEADPSQPGAVRPIKGGPEDPAANDTLDDATATFYAQQVLAGAPMPAMGMGKVASQNRQIVMNKVAQIAGAQGLGGADLARQIAHYKAGSKQLSTLETQLGTTRQNEATALANGQQFLDRSSELPLQTEFPALNSITQFFQKHTPIAGHDTKAAMDAAWNTFTTEYAKVVAGSPSGAGTLSDSARHEAQAVLQGNYSLSQKKAVFDQMKADMENRLAAMHQSINEGYDSLTKQPGYTVPEDTSGFSVKPGKVQQHIIIPGVNDNGGDPGLGGGGGGDSGPKLSPDQQAREKAFLATNPTKEQYASFLAALQGGGAIDVDAAGKRLEALKAGAAYNPNIDEAAKVRQRIEQENNLGDTESPLTTLVKQGATLNLSDEAAGVGNAAANVLTSPFTGHFDPIGSYELGRDVERQRIADAREKLGYAAPVVEFAGGMAAAAPTSALAAVEGVKNLAIQGAKGGAAGGALAGFGAGEGMSQSLTGAGVGGVGGAAVGALAPYAMNKVVNFRTPRGMAPDLAAASDAEGVDLILPMVDPASAERFNTLRGKPISGPIIDAGVNKTTGQIANRVTALGNGGTALEPEAMGAATKGTGLRYITQTGQQFNRLYGQIRQGIGDTKIPSANLTQQIDSLIADLSETPKGNAKEIAWLQDLKSDYGKDMSVDALRDLRTKIRQQLSKGELTFGQNEARVSSLADAASLDITKGLQAAGKGDLAAKFGEVDAAYRDRMDFIQNTVQKLIGKRGQNLSGEQVFGNLKSMVGPRGSASGITRMREQMTPEEANDMAATFAESLGKDAKGNFTLSDLIKQTDPRKMPPAMRRAVFGDDGAQSIENLRLLSKKLDDTTSTVPAARGPWRQAARAFVSQLTRYGVPAVGAGVGLETGSVGLGVGAGAAAAGAAGIGAARRVLSARALVNPRMSKWLAEAADVSTPSQAKQAVKGLSLVISREPALARELAPIRDFLDQRVTQLLAAQPNPDDQNQQQR